MGIQEEFDQWAASGKDRGMEDRHWHTAKHALAKMPVEDGDTILDLGTGSGYALRALAETNQLARGIGIDGSPGMAHNAREYTDADRLEFAVADFHHLPLEADSVDHVWSMEAFFYADDPERVLRELRRVLVSGGTVFVAVNYFEESTHTHGWQEWVDVPMYLWSREEYRELFRAAGLHVASQETIPDTETEIPPESEFPTEDWDSREAMVDRYRRWGTLLTVGVTP